MGWWSALATMSDATHDARCPSTSSWRSSTSCRPWTTRCPPPPTHFDAIDQNGDEQIALAGVQPAHLGLERLRRRAGRDLPEARPQRRRPPRPRRVPRAVVGLRRGDDPTSPSQYVFGRDQEVHRLSWLREVAVRTSTASRTLSSGVSRHGGGLGV